ncbi:helix-turn-helix transcriptional regulator [Sphingopyxis sp. H115]|uniref:helix-turn-helix transcriptional regulator n=1 Tax=Sphingopyxis sp. H115 TaxID=1759073 RepID=UPI000737942B|nr:AlpA family phage regulatory protein [Sphingopyxis sp. H115]KTE17171.1 AlpA family transcriptional regulator [Sphingopyxis sp. H115]
MTYQSPLRLMRLNEVLDLTGLSRATLYRKIAAGTFPPQHKLATRCCGWRASEINMWLRNPASFTLADLVSSPDGGPI